MTRTPLIAGNWKLHKNLEESRRLARAVAEQSASASCDIAVAPVFTALSSVREALVGSAVKLSAQDAYWQATGAFTGQVSAPLLADAGCTMCILGHSERRQLFGDTDETVRLKLNAVIEAGLAPILCVGESLEQREQGATLGVVLGQTLAALAGIPTESLGSLVIAYEPVWAIGTGKTASPADAQAVHAAIRALLDRERGGPFAAQTRILYGGSVKPDNAQSLLGEPDIDGALVGGASLVIEQFMAIVAAAR